VTVLTNEVDPVRLSYAQAYIRQEVDALNRQAVEKAISSAQSQVGDVHTYIAQAGQYIDLLKSSPDLGQSQADLSQLKSSLDTVSSTLHAAVDFTQNMPLFLFPGLGQPVQELQNTVKAVDDLRGQVDQLQTALTSAGAPTSISPEMLQQIQTTLSQVDQTASQLQNVPAQVLASPLSLNLQNVAPWKPEGTGFYAPAVLGLRPGL